MNGIAFIHWLLMDWADTDAYRRMDYGLFAMETKHTIEECAG